MYASLSQLHIEERSCIRGGSIYDPLNPSISEYDLDDTEARQIAPVRKRHCSQNRSCQSPQKPLRPISFRSAAVIDSIQSSWEPPISIVFNNCWHLVRDQVLHLYYLYDNRWLIMDGLLKVVDLG
jgi:hypothetical protein